MLPLGHTMPSLIQKQGWEGRKSSKSSSCNFGSSDWIVIGIGSQQLNVGFDNTLLTVESITKSFSANCGETCRGLPCLCNFMEAQTSLSDSLAHELWKSCSILAEVLVILVHTGMQGPFQVWLTSHGGSQEENLNIFWTPGREVTVSVDETSLLMRLVQKNFKPQNT